MKRRLATLLALLLVAGLVAGPAQGAQDAMTRAFQFYQSGEYEKAADLLDGHLTKHPDDAMAHYAMGLVQDKLQDFDRSLRHLRSCLALKPDMVRAKQAFTAVVQQRVYELIDEQGFDEALALAEEALDQLPEEAGAYFARGVVLFERWRQREDPRDHLEALRSWNRCRELKVVSATGEILNGIAAFESGDHKRAREHFAVAQYMRSTNRYAAMWLGLALAALGEYDEALVQLERAREMMSRNPSLYRYIGDVKALQGRLEEAEAHYRKALELKSGDARVHATLAELYAATGRLSDAAAEYREAARLRPRRFDYQFRLAGLLRDAGQLEAAAQVLGQARALADDPDRPAGERARNRALVDLETALILLEQGRRDQAMEVFSGQEAYVDRAQYPRVYLFLAQVGTHEKRLESLRKALEWSGPGARQLQADAFIAGGDLQRAGRNRLDAMEMYFQAWRRTPAESARSKVIQDRFEATRSEETDAIQKRLSTLGPLWLIDPFRASSLSDSLNRRLELVKKMEPGQAGELASGGAPAAAMPGTVVPAELEGELTTNVQAAVSGGAEIHVEPSWEGGQE